jgi:hypothetical protein
MKKVLALSIICCLLLTVYQVPAISENPDPYAQYLRELEDLESGVHAVLQDLNTGKNPQAVYEHLLQLTFQTATLRGTVYPASQSLEDVMHISLQSYLEILLHPEVSERHLSRLQEKGYTSEEITRILEWVLYYNDAYYHSARGFSTEQRAWVASLGLTGSEIEELQQHIASRYTDIHTTRDMIPLHQEELLTVQISLSMAALNTVLEIEKSSKRSKNENKKGNEQIDRLLKIERNLAELYETEHPFTHSSLEWIKAHSYQMIKAAEQVIRSDSTEYGTDFFLALQIHCAALTALSGDHERGTQELLKYHSAIQESAESPERSSLSRDISLSLISSQSAQLPDPLENPVGNVEEWFEENNVAVAHVLAKLPETSWMEYILMISTFSYGIGYPGGSVSLSSLSDALAGLFVGGTVSSTSICTGVSGGIFLLIMTAEPVGYAWPPYVPGWNGTDYVIMIVDGSYGQGHITERSQSSEKCIKSSHRAILDNPYQITKIIYNAKKIFYNSTTGQYIYYYIEKGKEWVVFTRKYRNTEFYELRTAYRADCPGPYKCIINGIYYNTLIDKWICEGFILIYS